MVATVILNLAYVALLSSTFTRTVTWLRVMLILGAIAFVVYGMLEGIWSMVGWNLVIGTMHLGRVGRDVIAQRSVSLTSEESTIRDDMFPGLSDFDFNLLWSLGDDIAYENEVIVGEGTVPEIVSVVLSGAVAIEQSGTVTRGVRRGGLIGEMSLVSGKPSNVNAVAQGRVIMRQWEQRQIVALDQVHPASAKAFRQLMERDLVNKART